jgi:hypothetical protein
VGDKLIEEKVGRKIRWELQFSKTSPGFQSGEYDFYFQRRQVGVDEIADLVDTAELAGIVERTGAWYHSCLTATRFRVGMALLTRLRKISDLLESIKEQLNG